MRSSGRMGAVVLAGVLAAAEVRGEETRTVAAGPQYKAGGFHEFMFGKGYRDLWTTPIEVPVLDLQKTGGGLTPVRLVGQAQGLGLAFKGADGKAYTFRSLHKHPERMLPEEWRDRFAANIAQDQSSHTHPPPGLIQTPLQKAAGVAHTNPRLVIMPDDPALWEFRKQFANEIGTFDEFPLAGPNKTPGFMGAPSSTPTQSKRRPAEEVRRTRGERTAARTTAGSSGSHAANAGTRVADSPDRWGSYYQKDPRVFAAYLPAGRSIPGFSRPVHGR